jgi:CubicO group peptidase (beta-lactamase class C family)
VATREAERRLDGAHAHLASLAGRDGVPSLVVLAAMGGREAFAFTAGAADRERGAAAAPDSIYGLGSVSKSLVALTVMHVVREGRLDLHRPVADVFGPHPVLDGVTAHHLLTHTSGLPPLDARYWARDRAAPGVWSGGVGDAGTEPRTAPEPPPPGLGFVDHRGLLDYLGGLAVTRLGPPGRWVSYSNEGYIVLAGLVAEVCGRPYVEVARERVLAPLGLARSAFIGTPEAAVLDGQAVPYARRGEAELVPARWWDAPAWDGPGGMLASARDLLAYADHLRTGAEGLATIMAAPHAPAAVNGDYGYGLQTAVDVAFGGRRVVGHGGGRIGTAAYIGWLAGEDITAVALCNVAGGPAMEAARTALAALAGVDDVAAAAAARPADGLPRLPLDPSAAVRAAGTYHSGETGKDEPALTVTVEDGALLAVAGARRATLRPLSADRYAEDESAHTPAAAPPMYVRFLSDGTTPAWAVAVDGLRILTRTPAFRRRV